MKDFLLNLIDRGDWLTLAAVATAILGLLVIVGLAFLILSTTIADARRERRNAIAAAEELAYFRGRRDERAELAAPQQTHDCRYPLIVETLGDGTQRRLDR